MAAIATGVLVVAGASTWMWSSIAKKSMEVTGAGMDNADSSDVVFLMVTGAGKRIPT